jgi:hypothetical protein
MLQEYLLCCQLSPCKWSNTLFFEASPLLGCIS